MTTTGGQGTCRVDGCDRTRKRASDSGFGSLCAGHASRLSRHGDVRAGIPLGVRHMPIASVHCRVEGCDRKRLTGQSLCSGHKDRLARTGDVRANAPLKTVRPNGAGSYTTAGYVKTYDRDHPIAPPDGVIKVHRKVLYNAIGPGEHPCFWCGIAVSWDISSPKPGALEVDHLNGVKHDNRRENLVPSCKRCNIRRARGIDLKPCG